MDWRKSTLIVDTDTGIDDAMGLVHAFLSGLKVEAITTVFGNADVDSCTRNALELVEMMAVPVPVYRGASGPIVAGCGPAPQVHGSTGRGDLDPPILLTDVADGHASNVIVDIAAAHPGDVTVIAMGRLTNVALACMIAPEIMRGVHVLWMGGVIAASGNTSPVAEANLHGDPEALQVLLNHEVPLTILPLDVTMQARLSQRDLDRLPENGHAGVIHLKRLVPFYLDFYESILGVRECAMHCGLLIALAMDPTLATKTLRLPVAVELSGGHTRGMLVVDRRSIRGGSALPSAFTSETYLPQVILETDHRRYRDDFLNALIEGLA